MKADAPEVVLSSLLLSIITEFRTDSAFIDVRSHWVIKAAANSSLIYMFGRRIVEASTDLTLVDFIGKWIVEPATDVAFVYFFRE